MEDLTGQINYSSFNFSQIAVLGRILLQTTPSHIIGQLDKLLREACTLDGVLEFRNEHFWTLGFGKMVTLK